MSYEDANHSRIVKESMRIRRFDDVNVHISLDRLYILFTFMLMQNETDAAMMFAYRFCFCFLLSFAMSICLHFMEKEPFHLPSFLNRDRT